MHVMQVFSTQLLSVLTGVELNVWVGIKEFNNSYVYIFFSSVKFCVLL